MELQLETRTCSNKGCSRKFRVLATSSQTVCSTICSSSVDGVKKPDGDKRPPRLTENALGGGAAESAIPEQLDETDV